jgi:hypothetical protein
VIAYKFLGDDRVAPFTRFQWPKAEWVEAEAVEAEAVEACRSGVHACRPRQLPYWLGRELWEIELDGEIVEHQRKVIARRGRLVRQIPEWNDALLREFTAACRAETKRRVGAIPTLSGYVGDIDRFRSRDRYGLAAFAAARAAELSGGPAAYERERRRQAAWLAERLGLAGGLAERLGLTGG